MHKEFLKEMFLLLRQEVEMEDNFLFSGCIIGTLLLEAKFILDSRGFLSGLMCENIREIFFNWEQFSALVGRMFLQIINHGIVKKCFNVKRELKLWFLFLPSRNQRKIIFQVYCLYFTSKLTNYVILCLAGAAHRFW